GRRHGEVRGAGVLGLRGGRDDGPPNGRRPGPDDARHRDDGGLGQHADLRRMRIRIGFKTSPQDGDGATLDATWRRAGELRDEPTGGFDSGWLNDHLTNMDPDDPGPSLEALTLLATLVHHVPGVDVGHGVLSNTFRPPVLLAKAAVVLDHATDGHFILGLGAGCFEGEHEPFGLDLPRIGPRMARLVSAAETLRALWSPAAAALPGVTRDDPFYPLAGAVNTTAHRQPGRPARLPVLSPRGRSQPASARTTRRPADLPRGPGAAGHPPCCPGRSGLAATW